MEKAERSLAKFESVFGSDADAAADVVSLGKRLEEADAEKSSLKLQIQESEAVSISPVVADFTRSAQLKNSNPKITVYEG